MVHEIGEQASPVRIKAALQLAYDKFGTHSAASLLSA
jgi:hypothetical protein